MQPVSSPTQRLFQTLQTSNTDEIKLCLKEGANVLEPNEEGKSPLQVAALSNDLALKILLDHLHEKKLVKAALVYRDSKEGGTALHWACTRVGSDISLLIKAGADVRAKDANEEGMPIHWAARVGHEVAIKILLSKGAKLTDVDKREWIPLHWSVLQGDYIQKMYACDTKFKQNSYINDKITANSKYYFSPLHLAARTGFGISLYDYMWQKPHSSRHNYIISRNKNPLYEAILANKLSSVVRLAHKDEWLHCTEPSRYLLSLAIELGHIEVFDSLVRKLSIPYPHKRDGLEEYSREQLEQRINNPLDNPLHAAARVKSWPALQILLTGWHHLGYVRGEHNIGQQTFFYSGANPGTLMCGMTALQLLLQVPPNDPTYADTLKCIMVFIEKKKVCATKCEKYGRTALHYAMLHGDASIIRMLEQTCAAALQVRDKEGKTPRDYPGLGGNPQSLHGMPSLPNQQQGSATGTFKPQSNGTGTIVLEPLPISPATLAIHALPHLPPASQASIQKYEGLILQATTMEEVRRLLQELQRQMTSQADFQVALQRFVLKMFEHADKRTGEALLSLQAQLHKKVQEGRLTDANIAQYFQNYWNGVQGQAQLQKLFDQREKDLRAEVNRLAAATQLFSSNSPLYQEYQMKVARKEELAKLERPVTVKAFFGCLQSKFSTKVLSFVMLYGDILARDRGWRERLITFFGKSLESAPLPGIAMLAHIFEEGANFVLDRFFANKIDRVISLIPTPISALEIGELIPLRVALECAKKANFNNLTQTQAEEAGTAVAESLFKLLQDPQMVGLKDPELIAKRLNELLEQEIRSNKICHLRLTVPPAAAPNSLAAQQSQAALDAANNLNTKLEIDKLSGDAKIAYLFQLLQQQQAEIERLKANPGASTTNVAQKRRAVC